MDEARLEALYSALERNARQIAVLQAEQVRLLAEYNEVHERVCVLFPDSVTDDIALALHSTLNMANRRLTLAQTLVTRLPGTLAALEVGDLDLPRAEAIAEATRPLTDELAAEVEDQILAGAVEQNPNQLRRAAAKAVLQLDPEGAEERHVRRRADRYVEIVPAAEGMADLYALLPGEDAMRIKVRLDAYAKAQPKADPRTMDQRRADAMTDLLLDRSVGPITTTVHVTAPATLLATATQAALAAPHHAAGKPRTGKPAAGSPGPAGHTRPANRPPQAGPAGRPSPTKHRHTATPAAATPVPPAPAPAVPVPATPGTATPAPTVSAASAPASAAPASPADTPTAASDLTGSYPAELAGYGVITAGQVVALASQDATWRRLLTDPVTGELSDLARCQYRPPAALADHVRARDRQCVFPGCVVPAARCDLDHRVPYPGGETSVENLAALCRHHHRLKHQAGWRLRRRADGAHVWTSPQEREYLNPTIPLTPPAPPPAPPEPPPAVVVGKDDPPPF